MTREEIIQTVNETLAEEFNVEQEVFTDDANVKETLSLDSLSLVDLIALVQQEFGVLIPVADLPKIKTFADLYSYIEEHAA